MIKGKVIAERLKAQLKTKIDKMERKPTLVVINVNPNKPSQLYAKMIARGCKSVGIMMDYEPLEDASAADLYSAVTDANHDKSVSGILVEKPYHVAGVTESQVDDWIDPAKDVDGTNSANVARLFHGEKSNLPCTPQAIVRLLQGNGIKDFSGKRVAIVNRSEIIGKPLALWLINHGAEVAVLNHYAHLDEHPDTFSNADIIIAATGKAGLINSGMITSEDQILVPVSEIRGKDGNLHGDFTPEALKTARGFSCKGNVGPLNIISLLMNVCHVQA